MGWELIEHTADVGLDVWGHSLDQLFAEAAAALMDVMGSGRGDDVHSERVELDAHDLDALFVDWLSEVLFLFEARNLVPRTVDVRVSVDPPRLSADLSGPDAQAFVEHGPAVKAITFHALEVKQTGDRWEARVYLDV